jgi:hypothetical protein
MSDGSNAAKGLPGYKKALSGGFYPQLFNAAPAAPPDAGQPSLLSGYESSPLIDDPPTRPPPKPDRYVRDLHQCEACGFTGFSITDAAKCPDCGGMQKAITPTYTPGTPWTA